MQNLIDFTLLVLVTIGWGATGVAIGAVLLSAFILTQKEVKPNA